MSEAMSEGVQYLKKLELLRNEETVGPQTEELITQLIGELEAAKRSNKALRRAALKAGQGSAMSSRLRDALLE